MSNSNIAALERFVRLDQCECGWHHSSYPGEAREHRKRHTQFEQGVSLPKATITDKGFLVVPSDKPTPAAKAAFEMARVAQREGGYDFPSFPFPHRNMAQSERWLRYQLTAYLAIAEGRAVGYASVIHVKEWAAWASDQDGFAEVSRGEGEARPAVNLIFVCKGWRRKGLATSLVRKIAEDAGLMPTEVLWGPPFTQAGKALACSFRDDGLVLVG